jgi:hypothetical protein
MVVAGVALMVALGGSAYAVTGGFVGSDGQIHGCVARNGSLVLVKAAKKCPKGQTRIAWEQRAPNHVHSADLATNATHATSAGTAINANHATTAGTATNASELGSVSASAYARVGSEAWHDATLNDGSFFGQDALRFDCYWQNYSASQNPAGYFRDASGIVHLRGLVLAHDGTGRICGVGGTIVDGVIFALPVGYQPDHDWAEASISNDKPGRVNIRAPHSVMGEVSTVEIETNFPAFTDAKAWVSLDGITFRCAPSGQNGCP